MSRIGISIISLFFLLHLFVDVKAQDRQNTQLLKSLSTIDDEEYLVSDTEAVIYVILTEKYCAKCLLELCDMKLSKFSTYSIKVIGILEYDLLRMLSLRENYRKMIPCIDETLFHFKDGRTFSDVYDLPSPQLIIHDTKLKYYNYGQTMNMIKSVSSMQKSMD